MPSCEVRPPKVRVICYRSGPAMKASPSERLRRRRARPQVSIVIPCYNEELNIPALLGRLFKSLDQMNRTYEVLFVDDGSKDKTLPLLIEAAKAHPTVRVIELA